MREFSRRIAFANIVNRHGEHNKMTTQNVDHETTTMGEDLNKTKYIIQVKIYGLQIIFCVVSFCLFVCLFQESLLKYNYSSKWKWIKWFDDICRAAKRRVKYAPSE